MFNKLTQFALPALTISSQLLVAMKYPQWGLTVNLLSQPFWLYTSWKSYKQAGQVGLLVTSVIFTTITAFGVLNYWLH